MQRSDTRRLYFAQLDGHAVCVGVEDYAGAYYASDSIRVPAGFDPVGKTLGEIQDAEDSAARERGRAFIAARAARNA